MHTLAIVSNIFSGDGLIIFFVLLLFFGAKKLPELARGLGSAMREFSKAKDEIHHEITRPAATESPRLEAPRETQAYHASTEEDYHYKEPAAVATTTEAPKTEHTAAATTATASEPPLRQS